MKKLIVSIVITFVFVLALTSNNNPAIAAPNLTATRTPTKFVLCTGHGIILTCTPTRTPTKVFTSTRTPTKFIPPCTSTGSHATCTPTRTPTKKFTLTRTPTKKLTPTKTPTKKFTPTKTVTKKFTLTATRTPTKLIPCSASGNIVTCTPTRTPTKIFTNTVTLTKLAPCSATGNVATCTPTPTVTKVYTVTATVTKTTTPRPTFTPTSSQTKVFTATATPTQTKVFTATATPTKCVDPKTGGDCATATATPAKISFAVIGDYGVDNADEASVATLVNSWNPNFVITTGDNNYTAGEATTIDQNIGKYYQQYIFPYSGIYGAGSTYNRFFPALGNHDWDNTILAPSQPYTNYFTLPGNERYYDYVSGPVHFFVIDSDPREPDGTSSVSTQAIWLQAQLAAATEPWKIVYMHHPPYSSGSHGSTAYMQWNFQGWGADAVLSGHDHDYERLEVNGFPYFVNGLGGQSPYAFGPLLPESKASYNANFGAMLVYADPTQMVFKFIDINGTVIDTKILP